MSEFDHDLNPLLRRVSNSRDGENDLLTEIYKINNVDPSKGLDALAREIRRNGGNTFKNWTKGEGPPYKGVVKNVAHKLEIGISDTSSLNEIELKILGFIAKEYWDKLDEKEQEKVIDQIKKIDPNTEEDWIKNAFRVGAIGTSIAFRKVISSLIQSMIIKVLGLLIAKRLLGMVIPIVNVFLLISLVNDIAGPAYRKIVHTVVLVSILRLDYPDDQNEI